MRALILTDDYLATIVRALDAHAAELDDAGLSALAVELRLIQHLRVVEVRGILGRALFELAARSPI